MEIFGQTFEITSYWWVGFAFLLGALELATFTYFLIGPGLAALVVAALLAIFPEMSLSVQIILFTFFSVIGTYFFRASLADMIKKSAGSASGLNTRGASLEGQTGQVIEALSSEEGAIIVSGTRWRAIWDSASPVKGGVVRVIGSVDAATLRVEPID